MVGEIRDAETADLALKGGMVLRKRLQVSRAKHSSVQARLVKLADKIVNLRDVASHPPAGWTLERRREYFDWAKEVIDQLRGTHPELERRFDDAYGLKP